MSGVRDPKDFPQTPCVKGIKALSQGLADGPCLAPIEQDWEDVSPVEVHLGSCVNMGPPDTLFEEAEALSCDPDLSQYLSLTSPVQYHHPDNSPTDGHVPHHFLQT